MAGCQGEASHYSGSYSLIHINPPLPICAIYQQDDGWSPYFQQKTACQGNQPGAGSCWLVAHSWSRRRREEWHYFTFLQLLRLASQKTAVFFYLLLQLICRSITPRAASPQLHHTLIRWYYYKHSSLSIYELIHKYTKIGLTLRIPERFWGSPGVPRPYFENLCSKRTCICKFCAN